MFKRNRKRKKGAILLEFLIVIPAVYFAAWACMFIIMFSMAQNTVHQAAIEGARILTQELRGNTGNIPDNEDVRNLLSTKVHNSVKHFNYVLLFKDGNGNAKTPQILIEPADCIAGVQGKERVICAQTIKGTAAGIEQQQIIVVIRSKFYVLGNGIPGLKDTTYATGKGSSEKEISGRFNYWN